MIVQVNLCAATLQDGVGLQDLLLDPGVLTADGRQKLKDQFGALSLSRSRLAAEQPNTYGYPKRPGSEKVEGEKGPGLPDDAALVTVVPLHVEVAVVSYGKDVRRHLADLLVGVQADLIGCVDRQQLVRVDGNQNGASIRLWGNRHWFHDAD